MMKRVLAMFLAVFLAVLTVPTALADTVLVEAIELQESCVLAVTKSISLKATVMPKNASNRKISWTSSDETIATVNASGKVTGVSVGSAVITATAMDDSGVSSSCTVQVIKPVKKLTFIDDEEKAVKSLTIAPDTAWKLDCAIQPEDATIQNLVWTSSNEKVATVDEFGVVKAIGKGTAQITARAVDGSKVKVSVGVKVQAFDLVFTDLEPQSVTYSYRSGRHHIKGTVKTGNVSIPNIDTLLWAMVAGGPAVEEVPVTPVKPGTDTVTISVGSKKFSYTVYVAPAAFEEKDELIDTTEESNQ